MQLLAPDLLEQARGLSVGVSATGLVVGVLLWLTGWLGHRFWIVLFTTAIAGILGLLSPPTGRIPPLVMGLLLAVAAGVLALALVRVVAFAAGGIATWLVIHTFAPPAWDEPLLCFLIGGLVGLLLFRIWTMALTSFSGTILMGYSGLCLLDHLGKLDAIALTEQRARLLNFACGGMTLAGLMVQFLLDRRRVNKERLRERESREFAEEELEQLYRQRRHWWSWGGGKRSYRRAG